MATKNEALSTPVRVIIPSQPYCQIKAFLEGGCRLWGGGADMQRVLLTNVPVFKFQYMTEDGTGVKYFKTADLAARHMLSWYAGGAGLTVDEGA